ncbi:MAG: UDP-N-acetylmuramoyl-L-alanyl-D-glutamate--2,6-diaminopimelate ligase [Planctomycetota bacterium]
MLLADLIDGVSLRIASGDPGSTRVGDLTEDSRTALDGSLFVARQGLKNDGREFIGDAIAAGATAVLVDTAAADELVANAPEVLAGDAGPVCVLSTPEVSRVGAVLAERLAGNPSRELCLIGITGTNGKTTVAHIVHTLLNTAGVRCGLIGTISIDDGRAPRPITADMTTPPAPELSRLLAGMVDAGCRAAVMEVSSHALDQGRVSGLAFDIGVITNLTRDHLDYHGSMERYAEAKSRLFKMLDPEAGTAIINADDPEAVAIAAAFTGSADGARSVGCSALGQVVRGWSVEPRPAPNARQGQHGPAPRLFRVEGPGVAFDQTTELVGRHNALNACQAIAAANEVLTRDGKPPAQRAAALRDGLSLCRTPPGRLEAVHGAGDDLSVFVDYAHTEDALEKALTATRPIANAANARLVVVFGAGGDRDPGKRPVMGRIAAMRSDRAVLTSDNPRSEQPEAIIADVMRGIPEMSRGRVTIEPDRAVAIRRAIGDASAGDVLVIAGKGHETYQLSPDATGNVTRRHFDDCEEARAALEQRRARRAQEERATAVATVKHAGLAANHAGGLGVHGKQGDMS